MSNYDLLRGGTVAITAGMPFVISPYPWNDAYDVPTGTTNVTGLPSWMTFNFADQTLRGTAPLDVSTVDTFNLTGTYTYGGSHAWSGTVVVDSIPHILGLVAGNLRATAVVGRFFSFPLSAVEIPGYPTRFSERDSTTGLPPGLVLAGNTISGTPTTAGIYSFWIDATNDEVWLGHAHSTEEKIFTLTVGQAPTITSADTATVVQGSPISYTITTDISATSFTATGYPPGMSFAGAILSGSPTAPGVYQIFLTATNAAGSGTKTLTLTVIPLPKITSGATAVAFVGVPFTWPIQTNVTDAVVSVTSGLPGWLSLAAGVLSGTPTGTESDIIGVHIVNANGGDSQGLRLTVLDPAPAPTAAPVVTPATQTLAVKANTLFYFQPFATNSPAYWFATLPAGLSIDPGTGLITGQVVEPGTYVISVTAANVVGTSAPGIITLNVTDAVVLPASDDAMNVYWDLDSNAVFISSTIPTVAAGSGAAPAAPTTQPIPVSFDDDAPMHLRCLRNWQVVDPGLDQLVYEVKPWGFFEQSPLVMTTLYTRVTNGADVYFEINPDYSAPDLADAMNADPSADDPQPEDTTVQFMGQFRRERGGRKRRSQVFPVMISRAVVLDDDVAPSTASPGSEANAGNLFTGSPLVRWQPDGRGYGSIQVSDGAGNWTDKLILP